MNADVENILTQNIEYTNIKIYQNTNINIQRITPMDNTNSTSNTNKTNINTNELLSQRQTLPCVRTAPLNNNEMMFERFSISSKTFND